MDLSERGSGLYLSVYFASSICSGFVLSCFRSRSERLAKDLYSHKCFLV